METLQPTPLQVQPVPELNPGSKGVFSRSDGISPHLTEHEISSEEKENPTPN